MRLMLNGRPVEAVPPGETTLLALLRDTLGVTGPKEGCARGECGACTVLRDGRPVYACLTLAHACDGAHVTTVEGLAAPDGTLHAVQRAFHEADAAQCGFCTPGQLCAAAALLATTTTPTDDDITTAMSGNLCRCGTYPRIRRAIHAAAAALRGDAGTDGDGGAHG